MIKLTQNDCELVSQYFPQLNCELMKQRIWGTLKFACCYDPASKLLEFKTDEKTIADAYEIEIDFNSQHLGLPKTYERSGSIAAYAEKRHISLLDLHMFSKDHSCCLGIYPEDTDISAFDFIMRRVIPYFYWQSHLRLHGKEPWAAYSHGKRGYEEKKSELEEQIEQITKSLSNDSFISIGSLRNQLCKCGSGKKYKKCCMDTDNHRRSKVAVLKISLSTVDRCISNCSGKQAEDKKTEAE